MSGTRLSQHHRQAGHLIQSVRSDGTWSGSALRALSDEQALSLYVVLVERASAYRGWSWNGGRVFNDLRRRALPWSAADVGLLFELAREARAQTVITVLKAAVGAAERLDPADRGGLVEHFRHALTHIDADWYDPSERARVRLRLRALIESADPAAGARVRTSVVHVEDGWSLVLVERLAAITSGAEAVSDLLAHAASIPVGPRPTKSWLKRTTELLARHPGVLPMVRELLELAHTCEPAETEWFGFRTPVRISPDNADLARGLLWTATVSGEAWLTPLVVALHTHSTPVEPKVLNTCFAVLGRRADAAAIAALVAMRRATRDRGDVTQIDRALDEAAANAGISRSELTEQMVSDAGLDSRRERRVANGDVTAILALDDRAKVRLVWEHGGTRAAKPPPHADPEFVKELKGDAAELRKLVATERDRLEDLLAEGREWPLPTWRQRYAEHPVISSLALHLLWTVADGDQTVTALPAPEGRFTLADGETIAPGDEARVRVWHPVDASPEEVRAWRAHIMDRELAQPFKQAFREVYLLTPAEEQTNVYSNRFAGHVLRYQQAYALMKERRWGTNYLGGWDGGHEGQAKREFPAHGLRALFLHQPADDDGSGGYTVQYCATDQVRFQRIGRRDQDPVPLSDVPAAVFSEAMRDVDLFVGVTSIATDPTWADRGTERYFGYWAGAAFGALSAIGLVRRQVLAHLLPKLKIRDRARLDGNYVVVDGHKRTYSIHIGSGNVQMSPNSQYLCIVPARAKTPAGVRFVPFEGDEVLAVVLSKALLLADDHRITDPTILAQIN
ncbi:DUF4132 domain-containing protein [Micromonospora sp. CPCC 205371]|nr:DUF4132 domain-containing protein [Micromonospora sp. CPCC 205371]